MIRIPADCFGIITGPAPESLLRLRTGVPGQRRAVCMARR